MGTMRLRVEMNQQKVLVIGASVLDRIIYVRNLPKSGETAIGETVKVFPGGKGANQALAAHFAGANVSFLTAVGVDDAAETVLAPLAKAGVNLTHVITMEDEKTAEALIAVDEKGNNQIVACPGASHHLPAEMLKDHANLFKDADWLLIQNELPWETVKTALHLGNENGCHIVFNPAPFKSSLDLTGLKIDLLVPNEIEAAGLLGEDNYLALPLNQRTGLWKSWRADDIVVTLGEQGVEWYHHGQFVAQFHPPVVDTVDTVGAGDAFCGVLTALLASGSEMAKAISTAVKAASLSTTRQGAQAGLELIPGIVE